MAELKACPFCGSELIECYEEKYGPFYCICACGVCGLTAKQNSKPYPLGIKGVNKMNYSLHLCYTCAQYLYCEKDQQVTISGYPICSHYKSIFE